MADALRDDLADLSVEPEEETNNNHVAGELLGVADNNGDGNDVSAEQQAPHGAANEKTAADNAITTTNNHRLLNNEALKSHPKSFQTKVIFGRANCHPASPEDVKMIMDKIMSKLRKVG